MSEFDDLMALDLEYRLTVAFRLSAGEGCSCSEYLIHRRDALIPATLAAAKARGIDPVDVFAGFAREFHARHENTSAGVGTEAGDE